MNKIVSIISCSIVLLYAPLCLAMEAQRQAHLYTVAKLITPALKDELAREKLFYLYPELQQILHGLTRPAPSLQSRGQLVLTSTELNSCSRALSDLLNRMLSGTNTSALLGLSPDQQTILDYMYKTYPVYTQILTQPLPKAYALLNEKFFPLIKITYKSTDAVDKDISANTEKQYTLAKRSRYHFMAEAYSNNPRANNPIYPLNIPKNPTQTFFYNESAKQKNASFNPNDALVALSAKPNNYEPATRLVQCYKIHLMPQEQDMDSTLLKIFDALQEDTKLKEILYQFKIDSQTAEKQQATDFPRFVIYVESGKNDAQHVLNKMHQLFAQYAHKGAGWTPRFNYKVNDFVFFAQGDGGSKKTNLPYQKFFEQPLRIYYHNNITGTVEDYHLINPDTGNPALQGDMLTR